MNPNFVPLKFKKHHPSYSSILHLHSSNGKKRTNNDKGKQSVENIEEKNIMDTKWNGHKGHWSVCYSLICVNTSFAKKNGHFFNKNIDK